MRQSLPILAGLVLAGLAGPAKANDSVGELGAGGIVLARTDSVELKSEDLYISRDAVKVDYVFANPEPTDISTIVAFPMPPVSVGYDMLPPVADPGHDNFMAFSVTYDGVGITPELQQRALAAGLDVTDEVKARGVPLSPLGEAAQKAIDALPDDVAAEWTNRGLISNENWDDGSGMRMHRIPRWELQSTFWWQAVFPAGREVKVSHVYKPAVGATAGLTFLFEGKRSEGWNEYAARYCMDDGFEKAVVREEAKQPMFENRIDYVLTSGGNWANGTIGKFRLTIDKGKPGNLVSFCGEGVRKTGPTTFEMTADNYFPQKDIHVLLLQRGGE